MSAPRLSLALAMLLLGSPVHAQTRAVDNGNDAGNGRVAEPRDRSLRVLVCGQESMAWLPRIRGQLSDLAVLVEAGSSTPPAENGQTAADVARLHEADLVVWLEPANADTGVSFINIWSARGDQLHRRAVTDRQGARDSAAADPQTAHSALLEIGALAVRSSVRAELAERAAAAVSTEPTSPNGAQSSPPPSGEDAALTPAPPSAPSALRESLRGVWYVGIQLGYLAFVSHASGQLAAGAFGGVTLSDLSVSLGAEIALPSRVNVEGGALELTRQSIHLKGALNLAGSSDVRAGPWVELGANRVRRETLPNGDALRPTKPGVSFAAIIGAGAFVAFPLGQTNAVVLDGGVQTDWPAREYLVARAGSDDLIRRRTWTVQPRVSLAWLLQF